MKRALQAALLIPFTIALVSANGESRTVDEEEAVRRVLVDSYIEGLINAKDFDKARAGIHEDFEILGRRGMELRKTSIDSWIESRGNRMGLQPVTYTIPIIDITGNAAIARLDMQRENLTATDYVSLYKYEDGWKIVTAIDHVVND